MASREVSTLVPGNGEQKTSGKAWGRVGKFVSGKTSYPTGVFFIVGNEFCERFSYYGMRAILVTYLIDSLRFSENTATSIYHAFIVICYFLPLLGAILADGYIGKYKTILYLSIVYAIGNVLMACTSFPPTYWLGPMIALLLIGLGTGGIKPCVSAFGGDQFPSEATKQLAQFFSVFYFAINLGSVLSTILTPLIRANVFCFGTSCFPLAFGIPAVLMVISLILFVLGRNSYKKYPPAGNIIGQMFGAIARAVRRTCCCRGNGSRSHWLDYADDKYEAAFLEDVKCVLRVLLLFLPLPVFWSLFDQQGSRWILQARSMDCYVFGGWQLPPELMQAINPILIIAFIPLFEGILYPALDKCHIPNRPLQRMVAGMSLSAVSFVVAGLLQLHVTASLDSTPPSDQSGVHLINLLPCTVEVRAPWDNATLGSLQSADRLLVAQGNYSLELVTTGTDSACGAGQSVDVDVALSGEHSYAVVISLQDGAVHATPFPLPTRKAKNGAALLGVLFASDELPSNHTLLLSGVKGQSHVTYEIMEPYSMTEFMEVLPGSYNVLLGAPLSDIRVYNGAMYILTITTNSSNVAQLVTQRYVVEPRYAVSVLWQFPQYFIITASEILFSISGLSFAYSQAPVSMKSVLQASWLLTVSFGNLLDMVITGAGAISNQAVEFFVFASLMAVTTVIFAIMTLFYQYTNHKHQYELFDNEDTDRITASSDEQDTATDHVTAASEADTKH